MKKLVLAVGLSVCGLLAYAGPAYAQDRLFEKVVRKVEARIEPTEAKPGQTVTWKLTVEVPPGWHTYPTSQPEEAAASYRNRITFPEPGNLIFVGSLQEPPGVRSKQEPGLGISDLRYYEGTVTWERKAVVSPEAQPGRIQVPVTTRILACDDAGCLPPKRLEPEAAFTVLEGSVPVDPQYKDEVERALSAAAAAAPTPPERGMTDPVVPPPPETPGGAPRVAPVAPEAAAVPVVPPAETLSQHRENLETVLRQLPPQEERNSAGPEAGLGALLLAAVFWGLIALVTPCVFPMIPITVSFFLKSGEHSTRRTMTQAVVYCLTIIIVLGTSAFTLLSVFRALSVDPFMNIFLGALFVFFALSLFGMYEITLPSFIARFTSSREQRGGMVGTVFMALTFTIISFTCVAPFLGGFSGMGATGNFTTWELALGGLVFACAFAFPFFLLALFPALLKKLPKSGNWLNSVKVVMGFLELAAALKFFRTAELRLLPTPEYFTYDFVLALWIAIAIFCGLYLLNVYRLPHDSPQEHIGVSRMLLGILFVGLGVYLLPALFRSGGPEGEKQRPGGSMYAWVDAFLLPEPEAGDLPWSANLKGTLDQARARREKTGEPQYVFVDFTGVTCTNCKLNERNVFTQGTVRALFKPYWLVQMYTDTVPEEFYSGTSPGTERREDEAEANLEFQRTAFGTEQLPLYVILEPVTEDGKEKVKVRGIYDEGKINRLDQFVQFLKKPFEREKASAAR